MPQNNQQKLKDAVKAMKTAQGEVDYYTDTLKDRFYWGNVFTALRDSLMAVEEKKEKEFGRPTSVWIEKFLPLVPPGYLSSGGLAPETVAPEGFRPRGERGERRGGPGGFGGPGGPGGGRGGPGGGFGPVSTNSIHTIQLTVRALNMSAVKPDANTVTAEAFAEELRSRTNFFRADETKVTGEMIGADTTNLTVTFQINLKLAHPIKL